MLINYVTVSDEWQSPVPNVELWLSQTLRKTSWCCWAPLKRHSLVFFHGSNNQCASKQTPVLQVSVCLFCGCKTPTTHHFSRCRTTEQDLRDGVGFPQSVTGLGVTGEAALLWLGGVTLWKMMLICPCLLVAYDLSVALFIIELVF